MQIYELNHFVMQLDNGMEYWKGKEERRFNNLISNYRASDWFYYTWTHALPIKARNPHNLVHCQNMTD